MRHKGWVWPSRPVVALAALCAALAGCDSGRWGSWRYNPAYGPSSVNNPQAEYTRQLERELTRSGRGR